MNAAESIAWLVSPPLRTSAPWRLPGRCPAGRRKPTTTAATHARPCAFCSAWSIQSLANFMEPDNDIPEYYAPEDMDNLIQALGKAGWLQGLQRVDQQTVSVRYSAKGSQRMKALGKLLKEIAPEFFGERLRHERPGLVLFAIKAALAAPELIGMIKSDSEGNALVSLVAIYAKEYGIGD